MIQAEGLYLILRKHVWAKFIWQLRSVRYSEDLWDPPIREEPGLWCVLNYIWWQKIGNKRMRTFFSNRCLQKERLNLSVVGQVILPTHLYSAFPRCLRENILIYQASLISIPINLFSIPIIHYLYFSRDYRFIFLFLYVDPHSNQQEFYTQFNEACKLLLRVCCGYSNYRFCMFRTFIIVFITVFCICVFLFLFLTLPYSLLASPPPIRKGKLWKSMKFDQKEVWDGIWGTEQGIKRVGAKLQTCGVISGKSLNLLLSNSLLWVNF